VGQIAQRKSLRVDFLPLVAPFPGHRFGERRRGNELRRTTLGPDRPAVERHAPGVFRRLDRHVLPDAFHARGVRHLRARARGSQNAPTSPAPSAIHAATCGYWITSRRPRMPTRTRATPARRAALIVIQRWRARSSLAG